ncbi:hypothetical protein [Rhizobium sp. WYJ-E13]|uniref:hypothetical protein n=1 Tax=Rhizobium sp. WYJ-E13 TaxID=2849093 RepID=UPI001C1ECDC6|nr:hypothetical protein [Rhizobium sp. WYJ-E13]QWW68463.1 hypothetical protein KQ933_01765 [Rhizobium sp. WYJ-E13]
MVARDRKNRGKIDDRSAVSVIAPPIDSDWSAPDVNRREALVMAVRPDIGAEIIRKPLGVIGVMPENCKRCHSPANFVSVIT